MGVSHAELQNHRWFRALVVRICRNIVPVLSIGAALCFIAGYGTAVYTQRDLRKGGGVCNKAEEAENQVGANPNSGGRETGGAGDIRPGGGGTEDEAGGRGKCVNVDIAGAVTKPGVYCMHAGDTLSEAVQRAGGFNLGGYAQKFVAQRINLAQQVVDGAKYYIPYEDEAVCQPVLVNAVCSRTLESLLTDISVGMANCGKGGRCEGREDAEGDTDNAKDERGCVDLRGTDKSDQGRDASVDDRRPDPDKSGLSSDEGGASDGSAQKDDSSTTGNQGGDDQDRADCIDINTASAEQLESIKGIGPSTAEKIINGRPYSEFAELLNIRGIGEATLDKITPSLCEIDAG